jgi:hypothetical protein
LDKCKYGGFEREDVDAMMDPSSTKGIIFDIRKPSH